MRDENDRHVLVPVKRRELIEDLIPSLRVKTCRRLIEDQNLRLHRKHSGDRDASLLSTGKFKWGLFPELLIKSDLTKRILCALLNLLLRKSLVLRSKADIREHIHLKKLVLRILKNQSDLTAQSAHVIALAVNIFSVVINRSTARLQQSVQMLDQRGFSGACVTNQSDKLSVLNLKVHIAQGILLVDRAISINMIQMFCSD